MFGDKSNDADFFIYTDGSAFKSGDPDKHDPNAWAIAMGVECAGDFHCLGVFSDHLQAFPLFHNFSGSLPAEMAGMFWAMATIIATPFFHSRTVALCMDAEALTLVLTRSTGKGAMLDIYDLLAGMYDVVRTLCNFTVNHVHAHDWHPWNEMVDSIA